MKYVYQGDNNNLVEAVINLNKGSKDSEIIVPETHWAILLKDGVLVDILDSGRYSLFNNKKFFFLRVKEDVLSLKLVYVSKTAKHKILWGTPNRFDFLDPVYNEAISLGANGSYEVSISDPKKFYLEIVGSDINFDIDSLRQRVMEKFNLIIESSIAKYFLEKKLSYLDVVLNQIELSEYCKKELNKVFIEEYGLNVISFVIVKVLYDEEFKKKVEEKRTRQEKWTEEDELEERLERKNEKKKQMEKEEYLFRREEQERKEDRQHARSIDLKRIDLESKQMDVTRDIGVASYSSGNNESKKLYCSNCGTLLEKEDKFCSKCGTSLTNEIICPHCKNNINKKSIYCSFCGHKIK